MSNCPQCGGIIKKEGNIYCNRTCSNKAKSKKINKEYGVCGKIFKANVDVTHKYCSYSCSGIGRTK